MKNYLFYTFLIFFTGLKILAAQTIIDQTPVDGDIWTSDGSPYHITLDVEIADLQIDPGVTVLFDGPYKFDVTGSLDAEGFYSDSIFFKPASGNTSGWQGISFLSEEFSSALAYCRIEGTLDQGILINSGEPPDIYNCRIINNAGSGLLVRNSSVELRNCMVSDNGKNGILLEQAQVSAFNSIISRNREAGISSSYASDALTLLNSVVTDNKSFGIRSALGSVSVMNSILFDNTPNELSSDESKTQITYCAIGNNTIYPGTGNINDDPLFADRISYALTETSPCVDAGNPNTSYNDFYFPPSFGTTRNDMGAYGGEDAGNWYAPLRIIPENIDFGNVTQDSSKSLQLRIKNYRNFPVSVSDVILNPAFLAVDKNTFTVPASGNSNLTLTFTPGETDNFFSTLVLHTNRQGIVNAKVTGRGVVSEIEIIQSRLDFGTVTTGADSTLNLDIVNWGDDTLRIQNIYSTNSAFSVNRATLNIVPGYALETVQVTFAPHSAVAYRDSLIILSNDPDEHRTAIPLSGTGQDGPLLQTEPATLAFGPVLVKTDSVIQLTVENRGDLTLYISDISLFVPDTMAGAFQLQNKPLSFPVALLADSSFRMQVRFNPQKTGADAAGIIFTSNDFYNTQDTISISGTGIAPSLTLSENTVDFDSVDVGQDSLKTLHIVNDGEAPLKIFSLTISEQDTVNPVFEFYRIDWTLPVEIVPGGSFSIPLVYTPHGSGADYAVLQISHNDPFKETVALSLNGYGVAPKIVPSAEQLNFGAIPFTDNSVKNFVLYNRGEKTLLIYSDSIKFTPDSGAVFSFKKPVTHDVALEPGDSASFLIGFVPGNLGVKNGDLLISSNDPARSKITVSLTGTGTDTEAATVTFDTSHSTASFISNKSALLSFVISAPAGIDSAFLFLRKGGQNTFNKTALSRQNQSNVWQMPVESTRITERGLEYYIQTYHGFRTTLSPENGLEHPVFLPVSVPQLSFPLQTKKKRYQQISVPLNTSGQTLSTLFEDDLGAYDSDSYRVFDYTEENGLTEIKNMDVALPPGKSLWLITKDARPLDIENGRSVSSASDYELKLKQGWNMIAAPFAFSSSWADTDNNHPLYFYNGTEWIFSDRLIPFQGYAVYVNRDTSVFVPSTEAGAGSLLAKTSALLIDDDDWHIQIQAEGGIYKDRFNFAGVRRHASAGADRYDYHEPPHVGAGVSLYFLQDANQIHYASDYRGQNEKGYTFTFEINGNTAAENLIRFIPHNLPDDFDWAVVSPKTGIRYTKEPIRIRRIRQRFILIVGNKEFVASESEAYGQQPEIFKLRQNYPNPFNPQTTAKYQLPVSDKITIEVYNILGQRVKALIINETKDAGYYTIKWNGTDAAGAPVSAGIYFLHLRSKHFTKTVKMILQK